MNKVSKTLKEYPFLSITVLVSIISVIFFVYLPFQINIFSESSVKKLYYVDNISDAHLRIIKKFNQKFKNEIEVVPVNLPFINFTTNDRKAILTRSLRNRSDGIDIFAVDLIWIPRFAKWSYTMNAAFDSTMLSKINKMALKACFQSDSLVAFPLFLDVSVLYYRKDLLKQINGSDEIEKKLQRSLTWNEFISLGKKFESSPDPFYIFSGGDFEGMMCCFHEMLSDKESKDIFNKNPINLDTPAAERSLQLLVDFIHTYNFSPYDVTRFDEYNSCLYAISHNSIFLQGWAGFHKQYKDFLRDTSNISNIKIAPLPHFEGHVTSSVLGGWSLMISKFSNRKKEALKFIDFMFEKQNQETLYEAGGYLPINTEVYHDTAFMNRHKELVQVQKILEWGKHRPFLENYTRISEIMSRLFHRALKKEITVHEALVLASKQINNEKAIIK